MHAPNSFLSLLDLHASLRRRFEDHQIALTELDLPRAARLLGEAAEAIRAHIRHEEGVLMPVYEARGKGGRLGDPEIFRREHRRIESFLEVFAGRVAVLDLADPEIRRNVIHLLDDQRILKQLLEHHDEREAKTLYPILDAATTEEERLRMLAAATDVA